MDFSTFTQTVQLRTAQFLTWFIGSIQTHQQYQQSERLQRDGPMRSQQDPDTHQRHAWEHDGGLTLRERFQAWGGSQSQPSDAQERFRQQHEWQQRAQHQQRQQRGGWGHGR
jgi:hypothetical protein